MSKTQVEMFLKNPKKFDRYYQSLVYSRVLFNSSNYSFGSLGIKILHLKKKFRKDSPYYWVYARDFMVLVHATGQDKLLKGVKPTELHSKFEAWLAWMDKYGERLIGHPKKSIWIVTNNVFPFLIDSKVQAITSPRYPFDDWNPRLEPVSPNLEGDIDTSIKSVRLVLEISKKRAAMKKKEAKTAAENTKASESDLLKPIKEIPLILNKEKLLDKKKSAE